MRRHPLELPDNLLWSPWKQLGFMVGAWFLLFLPATFMAIIVLLVLGIARAFALHW